MAKDPVCGMDVDEKTAKHPEMPRSAVASGAVDLALAPAEIARELGRLKGHMFVLQPERERLPEGEVAEADSILAILRDATGADFSRYKQSTIRRRVLRQRRIGRHLRQTEPPGAGDEIRNHDGRAELGVDARDHHVLRQR